SLVVTGNARFDDLVGEASIASSGKLTTLSVSGTTNINTSLITTSGTQTYTGAVTLSKSTMLTGSTVSFNDKVDGNKTLTVAANAVFGDGAGDFIGSGTALASLTVNGTTTFNA